MVITVFSNVKVRNSIKKSGLVIINGYLFQFMRVKINMVNI